MHPLGYVSPKCTSLSDFSSGCNTKAVARTYLDIILTFTFTLEMRVEDGLFKTNVKTKRHGAENTEAQN